MWEDGVVFDPLHGRIQIPDWLIELKDTPAVRRMSNIRQLGLKALTGFPGAIHTRYMHCLGVMHLADKISKRLLNKEKLGVCRVPVYKTLDRNREVLKAAGFFHDVGHGPFSHALDFVIQKGLEKTHEEIAVDVVNMHEEAFQDQGINHNQVAELIMGKEKIPFLRRIIDGPLDVDKADYLSRDCYHIGIRYGFDTDHLFDQIVITGSGTDLKECHLGLRDTDQARTVSEFFLLMWRSLYSLVYFDPVTRIAEKMLEKSALLAVEENTDAKEYLTEFDKFLNLDESKLLAMLDSGDGESKLLTNKVLSNDLYKTIVILNLKDNKTSADFAERTTKEYRDGLMDQMSQTLSKESDHKYAVICDIIEERIPKEIYLDKKDSKELVPLRRYSPVVRVMMDKNEANVRVFVCVMPELVESSRYSQDTLKKEAMEFIESYSI